MKMASIQEEMQASYPMVVTEKLGLESSPNLTIRIPPTAPKKLNSKLRMYVFFF